MPDIQTLIGLRVLATPDVKNNKTYLRDKVNACTNQLSQFYF